MTKGRGADQEEVTFGVTSETRAVTHACEREGTRR